MSYLQPDNTNITSIDYQLEIEPGVYNSIQAGLPVIRINYEDSDGNNRVKGVLFEEMTPYLKYLKERADSLGKVLLSKPDDTYPEKIRIYYDDAEGDTLDLNTMLGSSYPAPEPLTADYNLTPLSNCSKDSDSRLTLVNGINCDFSFEIDAIEDASHPDGVLPFDVTFANLLTRVDTGTLTINSVTLIAGPKWVINCTFNNDNLGNAVLDFAEESGVLLDRDEGDDLSVWSSILFRNDANTATLGSVLHCANPGAVVSTSQGSVKSLLLNRSNAKVQVNFTVTGTIDGFGLSSVNDLTPINGNAEGATNGTLDTSLLTGDAFVNPVIELTWTPSYLLDVYEFLSASYPAPSLLRALYDLTPISPDSAKISDSRIKSAPGVDEVQFTVKIPKYIFDDASYPTDITEAMVETLLKSTTATVFNVDSVDNGDDEQDYVLATITASALILSGSTCYYVAEVATRVINDSLVSTISGITFGDSDNNILVTINKAVAVSTTLQTGLSGLLCARNYGFVGIKGDNGTGDVTIVDINKYVTSPVSVDWPDGMASESELGEIDFAGQEFTNVPIINVAIPIEDSILDIEEMIGASYPAPIAIGAPYNLTPITAGVVKNSDSQLQWPASTTTIDFELTIDRLGSNAGPTAWTTPSTAVIASLLRSLNVANTVSCLSVTVPNPAAAPMVVRIRVANTESQQTVQWAEHVGIAFTTDSADLQISAFYLTANQIGNAAVLPAVAQNNTQQGYIRGLAMFTSFSSTYRALVGNANLTQFGQYQKNGASSGDGNLNPSTPNGTISTQLHVNPIGGVGPFVNPCVTVGIHLIP